MPRGIDGILFKIQTEHLASTSRHITTTWATSPDPNLKGIETGIQSKHKEWVGRHSSANWTVCCLLHTMWCVVYPCSHVNMALHSMRKKTWQAQHENWDITLKNRSVDLMTDVLLCWKIISCTPFDKNMEKKELNLINAEFKWKQKLFSVAN